jgi:succinate dehydrogenase / fumarate reductase cytochrome b subunit
MAKPKTGEKETIQVELPAVPRRVSKAERPLSPHLSVYRWQITNTLSILHRLTGVVLSLGFALLAVWLISAAMGPHAYYIVQGLLVSPLGIFVLFGFSVAFYYHLLNGIRHLVWDTGHGFELETVTLSGVIVLMGTLVLTVLTWWNSLSGFMK